jgi:hypothetical protein
MENLKRRCSIAALLLGAGCSSSAPASSNAWNQCNTLPAPTVTYPQTIGTGSVPAPGGGTIVAGAYDLTAQTVYGASALTPNTPPEEYVFTDSTFQGVALDYAADEGTWSTSGTTIQLTYSCVCKAAGGCIMPPPVSFGYTATPTQVLFVQGMYVNGGSFVQTFTKR